jgi:hypothetical protein
VNEQDQQTPYRDALSTTRATVEIDPFLTWCGTALGWEVIPDDRDVPWLLVPPALQEKVDGIEKISADPANAVVAKEPADPTAVAVETPSKPTWTEVLRRVAATGQAAHAAPASQPNSVHELTPRLFEAYTVDGGHVMLGGCSLEDYPLIRATALVDIDQDGQMLQLVHHFTTVDGQPLEPGLLASLHVDRLTPLRRPPRLPPPELPSWIATGRRQLVQATDDASAEPLLVTVVWCKYLRCKLTFEIGGVQADLPFSSWAQWLIDGDVKPPPFVCPRTGRESFHVVLDDDGVITVAEAIAECERTGRRVVETSLATCDWTGKRVLRTLLAPCPVTGQLVLADHRITCAMCAQQVSPKASRGGHCQACRSLHAVRGNDPRLRQVLKRYPKLTQWSTWRISETDTAWILRASSVFRRLLVVVDRQSLDALHLAESTLFSRVWSPVPADQWDKHLTS